jgi:hypothetical protein
MFSSNDVTSYLIKLYTMKKVLIIALALAPIFGFAQRTSGDSGVTSRDAARAAGDTRTAADARTADPGRSAAAPNVDLPIYYGEIIATEQQGRMSVRLNFEANTRMLIADKDVRNQVEELSKTRFESVLEVLNTCSAMGWKLVSTYESEGRNGKVQFFVIGKPTLMTMPPTGDKKEMLDKQRATGTATPETTPATGGKTDPKPAGGRGK